MGLPDPARRVPNAVHRIAQVGSIVAVVASMVVMFGYLAWKYAAFRKSKRQ